MKFCIAGKNNIAVDVLIYFLNKDISTEDIFVIVNKTDNGEDSWQRSLLKKAKQLAIKVVSLEDIYEIEELVFLSLEFDRIIDPDKFTTKDIYNIHFSLLPKYKGMFTSILPILNNENSTGVTLHKIDKGIDTGDIIEQVKFSIGLSDNSRDIYHKYINFGTSCVKKFVDKIINKEYIDSIAQDSSESSYYSKDAIDFSNIVIDLNKTAIDVHNQIRAYNFREYQVPKVFDVKIMSSKILNTSSKKRAGEVVFENDISYSLSTIDSDIVIYKDKVDEFFEACESGHEDIIINLLQIPKIVNVQNETGWTPLIVAVYNNHIEIVKKLLINGADINITNFKGTTLLMFAKSSYMIHKDDTMIKMILSLDVDIYQKDHQGKNVLDYCLENGEDEVLKIIKGGSK